MEEGRARRDRSPSVIAAGVAASALRPDPRGAAPAAAKSLPVFTPHKRPRTPNLHVFVQTRHESLSLPSTTEETSNNIFVLAGGQVQWFGIFTVCQGTA